MSHSHGLPIQHWDLIHAALGWIRVLGKHINLTEGIFAVSWMIYVAVLIEWRGLEATFRDNDGYTQNWG